MANKISFQVMKQSVPDKVYGIHYSLNDYEKWYAFYADVPYMPYEFSMWQYSDSGSIDGINGKVDLDISFKTW